MAIKLWPKKQEQVGIIENFDFLGHNFMANNRIVIFLSSNDSSWSGKRMVYELVRFDQIYESYGQSSANVATRMWAWQKCQKKLNFRHQCANADAIVQSVQFVWFIRILWVLESRSCEHEHIQQCTDHHIAWSKLTSNSARRQSRCDTY